MHKLKSLQDIWRRNKVFLVTALLVVTADQLSKFWIRSNLALGESIPETGFFRLTHTQNTGAAFGLFQEHSLILAIIAIIGSIVILFLVFFMYRRLYILNTTLGKLSLGLILGGTVGNLIDRLRYGGNVTDFIDFSFWPAFNIADSSTVVGAFILAYALIRFTGHIKSSDEQSS
jgi:signal peptidase II